MIHRRDRLPSRPVALGIICALIAAATASVGLGSEHYLAKHGDMPRYLMNAAFFYDLVRDHPIQSFDTLVDYARFYFARYPALSIGHHPVLVSLATIPFFSAFGVSVFAARLPVILAFVTATVYLYRLLRQWADDTAAAAGTIAFAASPVLAELSQSVMSEPLVVALVIMATYYLQRFCATESRAALWKFVFAAGFSVWAKQLAAIAFPGFLLYAIATLGWRRLLSRDVATAAVVLGIVILPMVPFTLALSPTNMRVLAAGGADTTSVDEKRQLAAGMVHALVLQFNAPLAIAGAIGLSLAAWRRRPELWLLIPTVLGTVALIGIVTRSQEVTRYGVYWMPAWSAGIAFFCAPGRWRRISLALVAIFLVFETATVARQRLAGGHGYEEAAEYVLTHPHGATVMFSGDVDTGYFVFFVRKHDPDRRAVVLRADKVFTTSLLSELAVEDNVQRPDEIRPQLQRLGVGYVVIEDQPSASKVLNWLRDEVKTDGYREVLRVPIRSTDRRLRNTDVVVYQVKGNVTPSANASVEMRLPVVSREVDVKLADLLAGKYLR